MAALGSTARPAVTSPAAQHHHHRVTQKIVSGETKKEKAATSFHGEYLILERLSLLLHFQFVVLDVAQFTLNSFSQLVQSLRLLLQLVYLVLFVLRTYSLIRTSTAVVGCNPVLKVVQERSRVFVAIRGKFPSTENFVFDF